MQQRGGYGMLSNRLRLLMTAGLFLALLGVGAQAQSRRVLRYEEMDFPWRYDPVTAKDNAQKRIAQLIFSGITKEVGKETYAADLFEVSGQSLLPYAVDEGYAIVINLKQNVRWIKDPNPDKHDEEPQIRGVVSLSDVTETLRAILNPRTKNYAYPDLADYIKCSEGEVDYQAVKMPSTFKLRLIRAVGNAAPRLMSFKVLPAEVLTKQDGGVIGEGSKVGQPETMLCTGPYWIDHRSKQERSITFRAYRDFHGGTPKIREIRMSFVPDPVLIAIDLEGEQCDLAPEIPYSAVEHLLDQPDKYTGRDYASFNFLFVGGNYKAQDPVKRKYINDRRFREALSLAVTDAVRQEMIKKGYKGEGAPLHDFFGPNAPYPSKDTRPKLSEAERVARINRLLDECGYLDSPVTFELKYKDTEGKSSEGMADIFVENANRFGIRMRKVGVRTSKMRDLWRYEIKTNRQFDFILDTYVYGETYDLKPFFHGDANDLSYRASDALVAAFAEFDKVKSPTAHWKDLEQIVDLLLQDHAVVCIGSLKTTSIWRKALNVPKEKITSEYFFNDVQEWHWAN